MKLARLIVVGLCVAGLARPAFAGDLRTSVAKAARDQVQTAQTPAAGVPQNRNLMVWSGGALVGVGLGMTLWGLLHTSDGKYVTPIDVSKTSSPGLVGAGLAVIGGGGALLFVGSHRGRSSAAVSFGPRGVALSKSVSW
jgi:hypothetical protein